MAESNEIGRLSATLKRLETRLTAEGAGVAKLTPALAERLTGLAEDGSRLARQLATAPPSQPSRALLRVVDATTGVLLRAERSVAAALAPASRRPVAPGIVRLEKALKRARYVTAPLVSPSQETLQRKIDRVRKPRVHVEYKVNEASIDADGGGDLDDAEFGANAEAAAPHGPGGDPDV